MREGRSPSRTKTMLELSLFPGQEPKAKDQNLDEQVREVIEALNRELGLKRGFSPSGANAKFVRARLNEGYTVEELIAVIKVMCAKWRYDQKMRPYLRPQTLFRPTNFEAYLALAEDQMKRASYEEPSFREAA